MSKLSISLEWFLQEDELKPDSFSKNHKIKINNNFFNAGSAPEYGGKDNELNPELYTFYHPHHLSNKYASKEIP